MAKMLLLDVQKQEVREVEANSFYDYCKLLNCDMIDITNREVYNFKRQEKRTFDIICDDVGLLKLNTIPSAVGKEDRKVKLVGNLLICNMDEEGVEQSLSEEEIDFLKESIQKVMLSKFILFIKVLVLWR